MSCNKWTVPLLAHVVKYCSEKLRQGRRSSAPREAKNKLGGRRTLNELNTPITVAISFHALIAPENAAKSQVQDIAVVEIRDTTPKVARRYKCFGAKKSLEFNSKQKKEEKDLEGAVSTAS